jgi:hypothetical protein
MICEPGASRRAVTASGLWPRATAVATVEVTPAAVHA